MRSVFVALMILTTVAACPSQTEKILNVKGTDLRMKHLQTGSSTYLVYLKKTADGPAEKMTLVRINIEPTTFEGRKAFMIRQRWEAESILMHTSETIHAATDFATLKHEYWWKLPDSREWSASFDFIGKQASVDGKIDEKLKAIMIGDFEKSFASYNLSWHSDLTVFTLFPYKKGRIFKVNFYDPGASAAKFVEYRVIGAELLTRSDGRIVDCWVMEYGSTRPNGARSTQRFWVSKSNQEVLKEEDSFPDGLRYKLKLAVSG